MMMMIAGREPAAASVAGRDGGASGAGRRTVPAAEPAVPAAAGDAAPDDVPAGPLCLQIC